MKTEWPCQGCGRPIDRRGFCVACLKQGKDKQPPPAPPKPGESPDCPLGQPLGKTIGIYKRRILYCELCQGWAHMYSEHETGWAGAILLFIVSLPLCCFFLPLGLILMACALLVALFGGKRYWKCTQCGRMTRIG